MLADLVGDAPVVLSGPIRTEPSTSLGFVTISLRLAFWQRKLVDWARYSRLQKKMQKVEGPYLQDAL